MRAIRTRALSVILLMAVFPVVAYSQRLTTRVADKSFNEFGYMKAIRYYQYAYEKDTTDFYIVNQLAEANRHTGNTEQMEFWLKKIIDRHQQHPEDLLNYAQALKSNGKYALAEHFLKQYATLRPYDTRVGMANNMIQSIQLLKSDSVKSQVRNISLNTEGSEMGSAFLNHQLIFSSTSLQKHQGTRYQWNDLPFLHLYSASIDSATGDLTDPLPFAMSLKTAYHDGPVCFDPKKRIIYFTRNNIVKRHASKSKEGVVNLKIFMGKAIGDKWVLTGSFPYNSDEYSIGHPSIDTTGTILYFASDMPGGYGKSDLYSSTLINGQWSKPFNLGPGINTEGNEFFPFISLGGVLYFASDGHGGLGGLDIYASVQDSGSFKSARNLGYPINSPKDDFGLALDSAGLKGYFTSNRPGGAGGDDIYSFKVSRIDLQVKSMVEGTDEILPNTRIYLKEENGEIISSTLNDKDGLAEFSAKPGHQYQLSAENGTYASDLKHIRISKHLFGLEQKEVVFLRKRLPFLTIMVVDSETGLVIPLAIVDISEGKFDESALDQVNGITRMKMNNSTDYSFHVTAEGYFPNTVKYTSVGKGPGEYSLTIEMEKLSIGKHITLQNLYYDLNKSNIRPDASLVLNELAQVLIENPDVRLEIGSHTDSRASAVYNMKLSQRRSETVMEYLIGKGIAPGRLVAKGFGESQLINKCADGIDCPEELHQANRRTVIEILNKDRVNKNVYYL